MRRAADGILYLVDHYNSQGGRRAVQNRDHEHRQRPQDVAALVRNCKDSMQARRLVQPMGYWKLSPLPIHPKADRRRQEDFRSKFRALAREALPEGVDLAGADLIFLDEARIG